MSLSLRLLGGPDDGRTVISSTALPPPLYLTPHLPSLADLFTPQPAADPARHAEYDLCLDRDGRPARAEDRAFLYRYRTPPTTVGQREKLDRERRAAAARAAADDATWRRIRAERPHYPQSWRDL